MSSNLLIKQGWASNAPTPFVLVDPRLVKAKYNEFAKIFPKYEIYYSVKANADAPVIDALVEEGSGFDVASSNELKMLADRNVSPNKIIFSAPIKIAKDIDAAYKYGVRYFAMDSIAEIEKLAKFAPGSNVYVRLSVDNSGALWPLTKKFGVNLEDGAHLLAFARDQGLRPVGATFHVGSQNVAKENWGLALSSVARLSSYLEKRKLYLDFISIGGGFPARYLENIPSLSEFGRYIKDEIGRNFPSDTLKVGLEPGRAMVAEAGVLVATVIGKALRGSRTWYYLDIGLFNGLMEAYEKFKYPVITQKETKKKSMVTLAGPSCDSVDVIYEDQLLPELDLGDRIMFLSAGAYTTSYKSYNGFEFPTLVVAK